MPRDIEVACLVNRTYNDETGRLLLTFEVTDPVLRQRLMREDLEVRLVVSPKEEEDDADL